MTNLTKKNEIYDTEIFISAKLSEMSSVNN